MSSSNAAAAVSSAAAKAAKAAGSNHAGAAALAWWLRPRDFVVLGLAVLALNVLVISGFARLMFEGLRGDGVGAVLLITLVAAGCVGASGTWLYRLQREEATA
mgnify:CR=1 FL=1